MDEIIKEKNNNDYSLGKIPYINNNDDINFLNNETKDKIKIIELSNYIDEWEKEILFNDKGFYSLKGLEPEEKIGEYIKELESFISSKIAEIHLDNVSMMNVLKDIKKNKINSIKNKMILYAQTEQSNWETEVYENALKSCINRAVLYKEDETIILSALKNAMSVINVISEKEKWNASILNIKSKEFKSDFYSSIINSFLDEKDIKCSVYFEKYKKDLNLEVKDKLENYINNLKNNIIAYNWAKELFSYNLTPEEQQKEFDKIDNKDIENCARHYISYFKQSENLKKENEEKEKNIKNWEKILSSAESDIDIAELYIDYSLNQENIKSKKDYIKQIKKNGYISTDKKQFIDLLKEYFDDFGKFKEKDISNFHCSFSKEDFKIVEDLKTLEISEFENLQSDYIYFMNLLEENKTDKIEDIYLCIKMFFSFIKDYKNNNKKSADIETRNKAIESIINRKKKNNLNKTLGKTKEEQVTDTKKQG